jgi:hypothetical protein
MWDRAAVTTAATTAATMEDITRKTAGYGNH